MDYASDHSENDPTQHETCLLGLPSEGIQDTHANLSYVCYTLIRNAILTGTIPPGTQLKQLHLAQELNVNQRTVREALAQLVSQGLAVHEPRKGVRTAELNHQELQDIWFIRAALESRAMEIAAQRITDVDIERMKVLVPPSSGDFCRVDVPIVSPQEANHALHWIAIRASGRDQLIRVLEQTWDMSLAYTLRETTSEEEKQLASMSDMEWHTKLIAALQARDAQAAGRIAKGHIESSYEHLVARWHAMRSPASTARSGQATSSGETKPF